MQGQIIKIISDLHIVSQDGKTYPCKCRGIFRKEHITPLVGDYVLFNREKNIIEKILPRKNFLERPKVANIDQAFIVTSLKEPDFSTDLLDKFIVIMELHQVEPIIVISKEDLVKKEELTDIYNTINYYKKIGYQVLSNQDISLINSHLKNKTSVFTGQTGAGKSTLLNKLSPDINLLTGEISKALGRGKHTTRVVELLEINGGKMVDTPGFSSLDFSKYSKESIRDSFIEFKNYPCPYKDCFHINEKECKVKEQVLENNIIESRYKTYRKMIERRNVR